MNKNILEAEMKLHGDNGNDLARAVGCARSTFSAKLNGTGGADFSQKEIVRIKNRYNLTPEKIDRIFFTEKVS